MGTKLELDNGVIKCSSCGDLEIKAYSPQAPEEKTSKFYQKIKKKLTEIHHDLELRLMEITKYTPK